MQPNLFKTVIELMLAVGTAIIMLLWVNKLDKMHKELDQFYSPDSTMHIVSDSTIQHFIDSK